MELRRKHLIEANASKRLRLSARVMLKALADTGVPRFEIVAYTGGLLNLESLPLPVVIDLADTAIAPRVPWLFNHDDKEIVGHHESIQIVPPNLVRCVGVASGIGTRTDQVVESARKGYPWNISIGVESANLIGVEAGESVQANGRTFTGPIFLAKANTIREISCVSIGADAQAYAKLLASYGVSTMTFEEWLASLSVDVATLTEEQKTLAKTIYDALMAKTSDTASTDTAATDTAAMDAAAALRNLIRSTGNTNVNAGGTSNAANTGNANASNDVGAILTAALANMRTQAAAELHRTNEINRLSAQYANPNLNGSPIAVTAIRDGWTVERAELAMLRAARPQGIGAGNPRTTAVNRNQVLSAALAVAGRLSNLERRFTPQILDEAHRQYRGRIGLQQLMLEAAYANGYTGGMGFNANLKAILQAAFSSNDVPSLLTQNVSDYLVDGFNAVDQSWRQLAAIGSVSDFKEVTGYRGVGSFRFEDVAPDGHIPHGKMAEASYGNRAKTTGKMLGITRQDLINDNLGVLTDVPRGLGRGGALSLIHNFWIEFLDNSAFFTAGRGNTSTGALAIAGLNAALVKFRKLTDENGDYVFHTPQYLVVPPELEETANQLYNSTQLITGNTTPSPDANPHARKYQPIVSPYLSDSRFTGYSTTAYYLIANPADVPVIQVVFLDGVETPTVESADVDFSQLGVQFRGYFDFGVRKQEYRGGVRSSGV